MNTRCSKADEVIYLLVDYLQSLNLIDVIIVNQKSDVVFMLNIIIGKDITVTQLRFVDKQIQIPYINFPKKLRGCGVCSRLFNTLIVALNLYDYDCIQVYTVGNLRLKGILERKGFYEDFTVPHVGPNYTYNSMRKQVNFR